MGIRSRTAAWALAACGALALSAPLRADDAKPTTANPVPVTRLDLKQALENSKRSEPRLPLPPLTAEEKEKVAKGDWSVVNNGRMRRHYLPPEFVGAGFTREPDKNMSLGYPFQTEIFWIVSRGNNCTYCLGHQESKLAAAGVSEDQVAALDGDWSEFTPAERAAFGLAKRLTFEPHAIVDADLDRLRSTYNEKQVLEVVFVTGNFNAMNRWTGALKIPQEEHRVYLTPTAAKFRDLTSRVAPLAPGTTAPACAPPARRPALESRFEVETALTAVRGRTPRLPLVEESEARSVLTPAVAAALGSGPLPQWVRLLSTFPKAGGARIAIHLAAIDKGQLDPKLRAEIAFVAARHDRAWYAVAQARNRLLDLGLSDDQIFALDGSPGNLPPADAAALALAKKLTVDPALVDDADIAGLRRLYNDNQVAEIVYQVTEAAFFDRVTEAAGLRVDE